MHGDQITTSTKSNGNHCQALNYSSANDQSGKCVSKKDPANTADDNKSTEIIQILSIHDIPILTIEGYKKLISKYVLRSKLRKMRHLVLPELISSRYLDLLFPSITSIFQPQTVLYNGGVGNVPDWKISCYLEVMDGGVPTAQPHNRLKEVCSDLLEMCNDLFKVYYRQQHSCNNSTVDFSNLKVKRLMTFITRYTPAPGEQALLKHVDGAGKVDGSLVLALPVEEPKDVNSFYGHGGGLTFWDGKPMQEIAYDSRPGDVAFIDRAVWHQANPITHGTRWALVIFYKIQNDDE